MKKRISLFLIAVLLMGLCLSACGGNSDEASEAGTYTLVSMTMAGVEYDLDDIANMGVAADKVYVTLNGDGTGEMNDGTEILEICYENGKLWPVELPDEAVNYSISGNRLTLSLESTSMVFEKSGATAGENPVKNDSSTEVGTYTLVSMTVDMGGEIYDMDAMADIMGTSVYEMYVQLNGDGTGEMNDGTEILEICYENGKLWPVELPDEAVNYSISGNRLTLSSEGTSMVFEK